MPYLSRIPCPPLRLVVDHLWVFEGQRVPQHEGVLFADGCTDLMFNLSDPILTSEAGERTRWVGGWVSGHRTVPLGIELTSLRFTIVGARLRPGGLAAVLGAPPTEAVDAVLELGHFWGADARRAAEAMAEAPTPPARLDVLERWLLHRLDPRRAPDAVLDAALERLRLQPAGRTVARLAAELGTGPRQLTRLFRSRVGIGPKAFQRLSRFRWLLRRLPGASSEVDWARLALAAGFSDQAHLCRELRALSGFTPTELVPAPPRPDYMPWAPRHVALGTPVRSPR